MNRQSRRWLGFGHLLITFGLVSGIAHAADSFVLVSDVDDTVKITNVLDRDDLLKGATSESVFAGMPELYRQLLGPGSSPKRLGFMSGSPGILRHHMNELLSAARFPGFQLTLRSKSELSDSVGAYKTKHMTKLYGASSSKFLLIGDDTESDPDVYAAFAVARPGAVLAIYIHRITGRASLRPGTFYFVTAYDIAMREFLAGRLTEQQAADVGTAVLDSKDDRTLLPPFQACPGAREESLGLPGPLASLKAKIDDRLARVCESNSKK